MDINDLRSIFTVLTFFIFLGIVWWAYSGHRKEAFDEAAMLPLTEGDERSSGLAQSGAEK